MAKLRFALPIAAIALVAAFVQTKSPDLCVPLPSRTAPALLAHLMTRPSTEDVRFAIAAGSA